MTISDETNGSTCCGCPSLERKDMAVAMPANKLDGQTRWTTSSFASAKL